MKCSLLTNKSSDSHVQQDLLRQELLEFASKCPELQMILSQHCTELDEAGDHFFDFIIDELFTNYCFNRLSPCDTIRIYNYLMPIFHDGNVII